MSLHYEVFQGVESLATQRASIVGLCESIQPTFDDSADYFLGRSLSRKLIPLVLKDHSLVDLV